MQTMVCTTKTLNWSVRRRPTIVWIFHEKSELFACSFLDNNRDWRRITLTWQAAILNSIRFMKMWMNRATVHSVNGLTQRVNGLLRLRQTYDVNFFDHEWQALPGRCWPRVISFIHDWSNVSGEITLCGIHYLIYSAISLEMRDILLWMKHFH